MCSRACACVHVRKHIWRPKQDVECPTSFLVPIRQSVWINPEQGWVPANPSNSSLSTITALGLRLQVHSRRYTRLNISAGIWIQDVLRTSWAVCFPSPAPCTFKKSLYWDLFVLYENYIFKCIICKASGTLYITPKPYCRQESEHVPFCIHPHVLSTAANHSFAFSSHASVCVCCNFVWMELARWIFF